MRIALTLVAVIAGCGDGSHVGADAPAGDAGVCGEDRLFVAELLDWDSKITAFHSIGSARWTVDGMPERTIVTTPHGVVELCVPDASAIEFRVDNPMRYLDGPAVITRAAMDASASGLLSMRALTPARAATFYAERGLSFDAARAHLLVYSATSRGALTIDRSHDAPQAADEDGAGSFQWRTGATGRYVLFPDIDLGDSSATLALPGGERVVVPLVAGELTLAAVAY